MAFDRVLKHVGAHDSYDAEALKLLTKRKNVGPAVPMPDDVCVFLEDLYGTERKRLNQLLGTDFKIREPAAL